MLEIRELIIEARVTDDASPDRTAASRRLTEAETTHLTDQVVRQVLDILSEQRERL